MGQVADFAKVALATTAERVIGSARKTLHWNVGVMEYWSIGKTNRLLPFLGNQTCLMPQFVIRCFFQKPITPRAIGIPRN